MVGVGLWSDKMRLSVLRSVLFMLCLMPAVAQAQDDSWLGIDDSESGAHQVNAAESLANKAMSLDALTGKKAESKKANSQNPTNANKVDSSASSAMGANTAVVKPAAVAEPESVQKTVTIKRKDATEDPAVAAAKAADAARVEAANKAAKAAKAAQAGAVKSKSEVDAYARSAWDHEIVDNVSTQRSEKPSLPRDPATINDSTSSEFHLTDRSNDAAVYGNEPWDYEYVDKASHPRENVDLKEDPGDDVTPEYAKITSEGESNAVDGSASAPASDVKRISLNDPDEAQPLDHDNDSPIKGHGMGMSLSFVGVPSSLISHWFDKHGDTWDGVANMGFGLDYTMRFVFPMELRLSLSWTSARTGDAYWLIHEDEPTLADYIENNLSIVAIEAAVYHIVSIADHVSVFDHIDFYYGGGLWGGVLLGEARAHNINGVCASDQADIESCNYSPGYHVVDELPPIFGFVEATVGFKFSFLDDKLTVRAEGGFKGYLYGQLGIGVQF